MINSAVSFQYFDQLEKDHQKILKLNEEENILKNLIKKKLINEEKKKLLVSDYKQAFKELIEKKIYEGEEKPKKKQEFVDFFNKMIASTNFLQYSS